jgi:hypothetical protein
VHAARGEDDPLDVIVLPEGMGLNHAAPFPVYRLKLLPPGPGPGFRMFIKPVPVKAVDKIIIPRIGFFPAKKDIQPLPLTFVEGILIPPAKIIDPAPPGKPPVDGTVSPEKVIRYEDPRVPEVPVTGYVVPPPGNAAATGLTGMQMGFV